MPMFMPDPERDEDRWDEGVDYSRFPQQYPSTPEEVEELQRRLGEEWAERLGKDSLPKTPGAGKVEAAGIEPASHSLPNNALSREEVCMCDAEDAETGEPVGWIACPESCCERPDHAHAQEAS